MTSGDIKLQYTASLFVWLQQHWNAWIITNMASLSEVCISLSVAYIALDNCIKTSLWGGCQSVGMSVKYFAAQVIQTTDAREDGQDLGDALGDALTSTDIWQCWS